MRPVSEYLKLQGRFGHLHAEHIAKLQNFANEQWRMMGVELPEALIHAADAKNLVTWRLRLRLRRWRKLV